MCDLYEDLVFYKTWLHFMAPFYMYGCLRSQSLYGKQCKQLQDYASVFLQIFIGIDGAVNC